MIKGYHEADLLYYFLVLFFLIRQQPLERTANTQVRGLPLICDNVTLPQQHSLQLYYSQLFRDISAIIVIV